MLQAILFAARDERVRVVAIALLLLGFTFASAFPFQSIIGVQQLHMSEQLYSLTFVGYSLSGMIGNLALGALSDFAKNRKTAVLWALFSGALGYGAFSLWPSVDSFIFSMMLTGPVGSTSYSLLFGTVRAVTSDKTPGEAASINSAVRSFYAVSWIVVPGLVGLMVAATGRASDSFATAALAYVISLLFYWRFGPNVPGGVLGGSTALQNLRDAARLIFKDGRAARLLALSLINSPHGTTGIILPLVITSVLGGTTALLGWYAGAVAFTEIPLMLLIGAAVRRFNLWLVVVSGGAIHAAFLVVLGMASGLQFLWVLAPLNALANAVLLTQHMTYCQELLPERPGLGSSLLSIVSVISRGTSALIFAGIGLIYGFTGALIAGAVLCLVGCAALLALDSKQGAPRATA